MVSPIIAQGTGYVLFAYDVAHAFDLAAAETRLASATQRQTVKQKRRAPAVFEDDPAPPRGAQPGGSPGGGGGGTPAFVEVGVCGFRAGGGGCSTPRLGAPTGRAA